jgi:plasmid stabilization system protein ParE
VKVHWTNRSIEHLLAIRTYVGRDSDVYADRLMDRLTRRSEQIGAFPRSGRRVPEYDAPDVREVIEGAYRIIYRIRPDQIDVLAVIHSAQQLPPKLG